MTYNGDVMDSKTILSTIFTEFASNESSFLYLSLSKSLINQINNFVPDDSIITDLTDVNVSSTPIAPFASIIKQSNVEKSIIEKNAYFLQKETLFSYFEKGFCAERYDIIIPEEIDYEKHRITETIAQIFEPISKMTIILNAQELSDESIQVIKTIDKEKFLGKIVLCFDISLIQDRDSQDTFYSTISASSNFFEIIDTEHEFSSAKEETEIFDFNTFEQLYENIHNLRSFLSLSQAYKLTNYITEQMHNSVFSPEQSAKLNFETALVYFYMGKNEDAINYLTMVIDAHLDDDTYLFSNIYLSQLLNLKSQYTDALKCANLVLRITADNPDSPMFVLSNMMEYLNSEKITNQMQVGKYLAILNLLKRNNLYNNGIYTTLYMPWYYMQGDDFLQILLQKIEESTLVAEKIGNHFGLSTVCHWKGIILSKLGQKKEAFNWYRRCNAIRNKIGNILAMTKIRNGLSYEYLLDADFLNAYDIINSFLTRIHEIKDYSEIVITLNNLAKILFYIRKFDSAVLLFKKAHILMKLYGVDEFVYVSNNDIIIFKAVIDCINGLYTQAKLGLYTVSTNKDMITLSTHPLKVFLQAMLELTDGKLDESLKQIELAKEDLHKLCPEQHHLLVFILLEYSMFLAKFKYEKESTKYWKEGLAFAEEYQLVYYMNNVLPLSVEEFANYSAPFAPLAVSLDYLEELATKEQLKNRLHKRAEDLHFLNNLVTLSTRYKAKNVYTMIIASELCEHLDADAVFIAEKVNQEWTILSCDIKNDTEEPNSETLQKLSDLYATSNKTIIKDDETNLIYSDISQYGFCGAIIIKQNKNLFALDTYDVILMAVSIIRSQLTILDMNKRLQSNSIL